jgi:Kef-type K+ transport system membrane component KefB
MDNGHAVTTLVADLTLQVALVLCAARLGGEIAERWLKQPAVLGELVSGILIGPFALGGLELPGIGQLFELQNGPIAVSNELYALAQLGSVILLFVAGLETDIKMFLRFGLSATVVAVGGVILPFILGAGGAVAVGLADSLSDPHALFMGAILTATSVGITARVLGDMGKLDTPEGVTILGAAVIDDVLGILALAVVIGLASGEATSGVQLSMTAGKALGAWLLLTAAFLAFSTLISRLATFLRVEGAGLAIALSAGLIGAYLADLAGLALIIGAYSAGLALSQTHLKTQLEKEIRIVYNVFVPIFFVITGMLVDLRVMGAALGVGLVLTALASVGKIVGSGGAALVTGFNGRGAFRVGIGMLPRGEVALVIAGAGLTAGVVTQQVFAAAVFVAVGTTVLAPPILVSAFRGGGSGLRITGDSTPSRDGRAASQEEPDRESRRFVWLLPHDTASVLVRALHAHLVSEAGFQDLLDVGAPHTEVAQYRRDDLLVSVWTRDEGEGRANLHVEASGSADPDHVVLDAIRGAVRTAATELANSVDLDGFGASDR